MSHKLAQHTQAPLNNVRLLQYPTGSDTEDEEEEEEEEETPKKKTKKKTTKDSSPPSSATKEKKTKSKGKETASVSHSGSIVAFKTLKRGVSGRVTAGRRIIRSRFVTASVNTGLAPFKPSIQTG